MATVSESNHIMVEHKQKFSDKNLRLRRKENWILKLFNQNLYYDKNNERGRKVT